MHAVDRGFGVETVVATFTLLFMIALCGGHTPEPSARTTNSLCSEVDPENLRGDTTIEDDGMVAIYVDWVGGLVDWYPI